MSVVVTGDPDMNVREMEGLLQAKSTKVHDFKRFAKHLLRVENNKELIKQIQIRAKNLKKTPELMNLTETELSSILLYTSEPDPTGKSFNVYLQLNDAFIQRNRFMLDIFKDMVISTISGLRKMPFTPQSVVFRGISVRNTVLKYEVGQTIFWPSFSSTSPEIHTARQFARSRAMPATATTAATPSAPGTLFFIFGDFFGHDISGTSLIATEKEIILEPSFHFKVAFIYEGGPDKPDVIGIEGIKTRQMLQDLIPNEFAFERTHVITMEKNAALLQTMVNAQFDDPEAMYQLGMEYIYGTQLYPDYAQAFYWFQQASFKGHPMGQFMTGHCFFTGRGGVQKYFSAKTNLEKAKANGVDCHELDAMLKACTEYAVEAERGDTDKMVKTADFIIKTSLPVTKRVESARALIEEARLDGINDSKMSTIERYCNLIEGAKNKDLNSLITMGKARFNGTDVEQSFTEAKEYLTTFKSLGGADPQLNNMLAFCDDTTIAAERGFADCELELGLRFLNGSGIDQSFARAAYWFDSAARKGHPEALYQYGFLLFDGKGESPDTKKAVDCWERAATCGHTKAQLHIGKLRFNGTECKQNYFDAKKWLTMAVNSGENDQEAFDMLNFFSEYDNAVARNDADELFALATKYINTGDDGYVMLAANLFEQAENTGKHTKEICEANFFTRLACKTTPEKAELLVPTTEVLAGGAFYDPVRKIIVENSYQTNCGKDVIVTHIDTGSYDVKTGLIPFEVYCAPVYDGVKYVYVIDYLRKGFGRFDLDEFKFEKLPSPEKQFAYVNGFCVNGVLYFFNNAAKCLTFDATNQVWGTAYVNISDSDSRVRFIPHPKDLSLLIQITKEGNVQEVSLYNGEVKRSYNAVYDRIDDILPFEAIVVPTASDAFFIYMCCGGSTLPWRVFSSVHDKWLPMPWPSTGFASSASFYDSEANTVYFHVVREGFWRSVKLPTLTPATVASQNTASKTPMGGPSRRSLRPGTSVSSIGRHTPPAMPPSGGVSPLTRSRGPPPGPPPTGSRVQLPSAGATASQSSYDLFRHPPTNRPPPRGSMTKSHPGKV